MHCRARTGRNITNHDRLRRRVGPNATKAESKLAYTTEIGCACSSTGTRIPICSAASGRYKDASSLGLLACALLVRAMVGERLVTGIWRPEPEVLRTSRAAHPSGCELSSPTNRPSAAPHPAPSAEIPDLDSMRIYVGTAGAVQSMTIYAGGPAPKQRKREANLPT